MLQNSQHSGGCDHFLFPCFPPDCMIMKETSVLKRSATENVCSSWIFNGHLLLQSLVLPTLFLSLFLFAERWKRKEEEEKKTQANKPHCPDYKYRQKKGPLRCGWCETPQLSWQRVFALQFFLRTFDVACVWIFLHFESIKILEEGYKFYFVFPHQGIISIFFIILDVINLNINNLVY